MDHRAMIFCLSLALTIVPLSLWGQGDPTAHELEAVRAVQRHLQQNELPEAEAEFSKQIRQHSESARVHALHMNFAFAYRRANRHADAFEHMSRLVDFYLTASHREPRLYQQLANALVSMSGYSRVPNQVEPAREKILHVLDELSQRQSREPTEETLGALHDVRLRLIEFLISIEDYRGAGEQLDLELRLAKQEYEQKSDSPDYILRLANALKSRVELREALGSESLGDARERQLTFLQTKAEEHPAHPGVVSAYLEAHLTGIGALANARPDQAAKLLVRTQKFLAGLDRSQRELEQQVLIAESSFRYLQRSIDEGRHHARLVGKPSPPPEFAAWFNGDPLTAEDLRGKVVLLDFWAVWCGPCLEAFPHLTRWNERHADAGLRIIGVTRFYNYRWDPERRLPVRETERELPQQEELEMLEQFARERKLDYRMAVTTPGSPYPDRFSVRGLPQTVLIDREGKIRLIRVGTGPTVFREIEQTLERLLAEKSPESDQAP
jgi:thiol-disulfide isomerase/thioredoxin